MFRLIFFVKVIIIICLPFLFIHCGELCPLDDYNKNLLVQANKNYGNYVILMPIDCEFYYIDCHLKKDIIDTLALRKLSKSLSGDEKKGGWGAIIVFDSKGGYVFTCSDRGNISIGASL